MSQQDDILGQNIGQLLRAAAPRQGAGLNEDLWQTLRGEVRRQRRGRLVASAWKIGAGSGLAAAIVLVAIILWPARSAPTEAIARVQEVQGLAWLQDAQQLLPMSVPGQIKPGQWLQTNWGSQVKLALADQTTLLVQPHSLLGVLAKPDGQKIQLEEGWASIEAAKQPPGRSLTIQTPAAEVTVLGTKLDVSVVQKASGHKQTRVSVREGRARMASSGQEVILLANMEGLAEDGQLPISRSLTAEVNEMAQLLARGRQLAPPGSAPGLPIIIEFNNDGSANLWAAAIITNTNPSYSMRSCELRCRLGGEILQAHTQAGGQLPVSASGRGFTIDLSACPIAPGAQQMLFVQAYGVVGLFADMGSENIDFHPPACGQGPTCLWQFRLPAVARVEHVSPEPTETRRSLSRLVITVATDSQMPVFDQP